MAQCRVCRAIRSTGPWGNSFRWHSSALWTFLSPDPDAHFSDLTENGHLASFGHRLAEIHPETFQVARVVGTLCAWTVTASFDLVRRGGRELSAAGVHCDEDRPLFFSRIVGTSSELLE